MSQLSLSLISSASLRSTLLYSLLHSLLHSTETQMMELERLFKQSKFSKEQENAVVQKIHEISKPGTMEMRELCQALVVSILAG